MYEPRTYRLRSGSDDLWSFEVAERETDLFISVGGERCSREQVQERALEAVRGVRAELEQHIAERAEFLTSRRPLVTPVSVPRVLVSMYSAAQASGVGPMAAVAGAVAERVGRALLGVAEQVIVENGGDIFLATGRERTIAVYAGDSALSERVGLAIPGAAQPLGICTSSGTVGPSFSAGRADAAVVCAADAALADAAATGLGNRVSSPADVQTALAWAKGLAGLQHALVITGSTLGAWGEFELRPIAR